MVLDRASGRGTFWTLLKCPSYDVQLAHWLTFPDSPRSLICPKRPRNAAATYSRAVIETEESYLSGKNPVGLAAAAVYAGALLTNEKVTQPAVGEVADISTVTIRKRYKDLIEFGEDIQVP